MGQKQPWKLRGTWEMVKQNCQIRKINLLDIVRLRRLFIEALKIDFDYFPKEYLAQVNRQNSIFNLSLATLNSNRLLIGSWDGKKLVGYLIGDKTNKDLGQIFWLFVLPEYRNHKIGRSLMDETLSWFKNLDVSRVQLVTHKHKDYYLKQNFQIDKLVPKMIGDIDMYLMSINLDDNEKKSQK